MRSAQRMVLWLLDALCALTGHAGGCAVLNHGPTGRLWWWAVVGTMPSGWRASRVAHVKRRAPR